MPGHEFYITTPQLMAARLEYEAGWSAEEIARRHWEEWGYSQLSAAARALRKALRLVGVEVRDARTASREYLLLHGDSCRAFRDPGHPEHGRYLAYQRASQGRRRAARRKAA